MSYYRCEIWPWQEKVEYCELPVVARTKCGVVLDEGFRKVYVGEVRNGKATVKRYAWPTKAEALQSLLARKRKQVEILEGRLRAAREALTLVQREERDPQYVPKLLPEPKARGCALCTHIHLRFDEGPCKGCDLSNDFINFESQGKNTKHCPECGTVIASTGYGCHHSASCSLADRNFHEPAQAAASQTGVAQS